MTVTELETQKLTRGKVLKRMGIGAAAAWTVPMFFTTTEAWAVGGKTCAQQAARNGAAACTPCPACNNICRGAPSCVCACFTNFKGCCVCIGNTSCDAQRCTVTRDCPAGTQCVFTCCDGSGQFGFRCLPNCSPAVAAEVAALPAGTQRPGSVG
jgi:hypothetical protein